VPDAEVSTGLLLESGGDVEHDQREVGRRGAGRHVAGVLHVARAVRDDELARGRRRVAIGHVDGDALLAFRAQSVGHETEVEVADAAFLRSLGDGVELVVEELARVDQDPSDQGRLAVVDRADGR